MKKVLVFIIIFFYSFFSTKNIIIEKWNQWQSITMGENKFVKAKEMGLTLKAPPLPESKMLDVPILNQLAEPHLKNGCEVTSLAMMLNYEGIEVTKNKLAEKIKKEPILYPTNKKGNPNFGFVGDMADGPGYSVYNGPIFDLAQSYVGKKAVNLTGSPFEDLLKKVAKGHPVWIITTKDFDSGVKFEKWETNQGIMYITYSEHSAVITGYDQNYIYVNDPYGYKDRKIERNQFIDAWKIMGKQAIVIES